MSADFNFYNPKSKHMLSRQSATYDFLSFYYHSKASSPPSPWMLFAEIRPDWTDLHVCQSTYTSKVSVQGSNWVKGVRASACAGGALRQSSSKSKLECKKDFDCWMGAVKWVVCLDDDTELEEWQECMDAFASTTECANLSCSSISSPKKMRIYLWRILSWRRRGHHEGCSLTEASADSGASYVRKPFLLDGSYLFPIKDWIIPYNIVTVNLSVTISRVNWSYGYYKTGVASLCQDFYNKTKDYQVCYQVTESLKAIDRSLFNYAILISNVSSVVSKTLS